MKNSQASKPFFGAALFNHRLKEYGPDKTMLSGIKRIADEAYNGGYKDGYQQGVLNTLDKLFGNKQNRER